MTRFALLSLFALLFASTLAAPLAPRDDTKEENDANVKEASDKLRGVKRPTTYAAVAQNMAVRRIALTRSDGVAEQRSGAVQGRVQVRIRAHGRRSLDQNHQRWHRRDAAGISWADRRYGLRSLA